MTDRPVYTLELENDIRERIAAGGVVPGDAAMLAADAMTLAHQLRGQLEQQIQALRFALDVLQWVSRAPKPRQLTMSGVEAQLYVQLGEVA